jgi:hypothetical protein
MEAGNKQGRKEKKLLIAGSHLLSNLEKARRIGEGPGNSAWDPVKLVSQLHFRHSSELW